MMKKNRKYLFIFVIVLSLTLTLTAFPSYAQSIKTLHERSQNSYKKYMKAIESSVSSDDVRTALEQYQADYNAYLDALGQGDVDQPVTNGNFSTAVSKRAPGIGLSSGNDPRYKRKISNKLYGKKSKLNRILISLENSLKTATNPNVVARLKLEIAFIYEEFKQDKVHAKQLLDDVVAMGQTGKIDKDIYQKALAEQKKVNARVKVDHLMDNVFEKKKAAYDARDKYESYSFFKNPISKTFSLFKKWGKAIKYKYAIAKMRKYKYEYQREGEYNIAADNLKFMYNAIKFDLNCSDVFEAIDMTRPSPMADVHLITHNNQAWYARWYMLNKAKKSIDLTYFIVEKDIFGMSLMGVLLKKAKEGVKINFMVDARGTKSLSKSFLGQDYLQELVQYPNVRVKVYNPNLEALTRLFENIRNITTSDHDKIIVVDGEYCITGGRNISMNYFVEPKDNEKVFRDTDVFIHSPLACEQLDLAFREEFDGLNNHEITKDLFGNWISREDELLWAYKAMDRYIKGNGFYPETTKYIADYNYELASYPSMVTYNSFIPFNNEARVPIEILDKHSFISERNDITTNLMRFISAARDEIIIQNPYVIITPSIYQALKEADRRGVKIIIHTNSPVSTDSILTQAFFVNDWIKFLKELKHLRIFVFVGKSKLHAKTFCFDKQVSVIGTYNMDYMSEQLNSEVVAAIDSARFAKHHRDLIMKDIAISEEYKIKVDDNGNVTIINGPRNITPKKTMRILDILRKFKILKPLI